jgi:hypothetical protein
LQTPLKMPLAVQRDRGGLPVRTGFPIELNDIDGVTTARHVDAHGAGELVAVDDGMDRIADSTSVHRA